MSYVRRRQTLSGAAEYLTTAAQALSAVKNVLDDPALPEVTRIVLDLHRLEQPAPEQGAPPPTPVKGIGLSRVVKPLRAYHYAVANKWVVPVGIAAVLLVPGLVGYVMGRRQR